MTLITLGSERLKHCTGIVKSMGSIPVEAWIFFQLHSDNFLSCFTTEMGDGYSSGISIQVLQFTTYCDLSHDPIKASFFTVRCVGSNLVPPALVRSLSAQDWL